MCSISAKLMLMPVVSWSLMCSSGGTQTNVVHEKAEKPTRYLTADKIF